MTLVTSRSMRETGEHVMHMRSVAHESAEVDIRPMLRMLQKAWHYAYDVGEDPWLFAVEIHRLRALGLSDCDLRWLVLKRLVQHGFENAAGRGGDSRQFTVSTNLTFAPESCFVLTEEGMAFASHLLVPTPTPSAVMSASKAYSLKPVWDASRRMLLLGPQVVKHFRVPAPLQEVILNAFAEEGWAARVDDPLPLDPHTDAKRRVQSVIMCLNRNQRERLIRFRGDGTGTGIMWEPARSA